MNEKKDLELFYILPYTKSYDSGGYYRNDDTGGLEYSQPSENIYYGNPLVFDEKEQLLNWVYQNAGKPTPTVYRIKYIDNYLGVDDVFKITNLKDNKTEYYTALDEDSYAKYDEYMSEDYGKNIWVYRDIYRYDDSNKALFRFKYIYGEFIKRGIKTKFNVYEKIIDNKDRFEFITNSFYDSLYEEEAKGKKLVLYNRSLKSF